jgi:hypothetical protein
MKRFLTACLGMVLLGTAGLLILHQVVEFPPRAVAQKVAVPAGGSVELAPAPGRPAEPGQYGAVIPALLDALADPDGGVRQLAAATLVTVGPDAVPPLLDALKSKDRDTRANAAYVLGHLGEPARGALPPLAKALKDDDKEVRRRAAYALHSLVSQHQAAVAMTASAPDAVVAGEGAPAALAARPMIGAGPIVPGMQTPLDPGLLLPALIPQTSPEKEGKKEPGPGKSDH